MRKQIFYRITVFSLLLVFCMSMFSFVTPVAFASDRNGETDDPSRIGGSNTGYIEREISRSLLQRDMFLTWHPDVEPAKNVDFYYFQNKTEQVTLSVGGTIKGVLSVIANIQLEGSSVTGRGYMVPEPEKWSRPAVYGDIYEIRYYYGLYDFNL